MLELLSVADVATELGALVLGMGLQFSKGLPDDLRASLFGFWIILPASVRELTEVNAVSEHLVDLLKKVSSSLTVGAADIKLWGHEHLGLVLASASCVYSSLVTGSIVDDISVSIDELLMGLNE